MAFTISFNEVGGFWQVFQDGSLVGRGSAPIDAITAAISFRNAPITSADRSDLLASAAEQEEQRQAQERERTRIAQQSAADSQKVLNDPSVQKATETATGSTQLNADEQNRLTELGNGEPVALSESTGLTEPGQAQSDNNETTVSQSPVRVSNANTAVPADQRSKAGRPNPLDAYTNYTYGISLHVIPRDVYNKLVDSPTKYVPTGTVLIASGGRSDEKFSFSDFFNRADFYFENLKLNTVIGMNSRTRSSNVVDLSFTIVEPIGMTLLNRLLLTARRYKISNWGQMPFMLQIDFFGNTDSGTVVKIQSQTKYIPIKLIDCKIKVSTRGSEYYCTAVPYSHQSYNESAASSPASFEVHSDSVGNFFNFEKGQDSSAGTGLFSARADIAKAAADNVRNAEDGIKQAEGVNGNDARLFKLGRERAQQEQALVSATPWRINSYAAALNSNQLQLKEKKYQTVADEYYFVIDKEIAESKLVLPKPVDNPTRNSSIRRLDQADARRATLAASNATIVTKDQAIAINAGTSIIDVINLVIRNSAYITSQIQASGPNKVTQDSKPIKWYKITCKVKLKEFDTKRKVYGKIFTYFITKYEYYNTKYPETSKSLPSQWEKTYNYSYTGQNQSVIDFNLDFNTAFFTAMTAMRESESAIDPGPDENDDAKQFNSETSASGDNTQNSIQPNQYRPQTYISTTSFETAGTNDKNNASANDLYNSIMTSSRGDMINVKLKIAGDPEFIKQDDIFFNPSTQSKTASIDQNNGSLIMDASEIFTYLNFRIPTDIDQNTGLVTFSTKNAQGQTLGDNVFNGIYKVITVENHFDRGAFTQSLDLVRLFGQEELLGQQNSQNRSQRGEQTGRAEDADAEEAQLELLNNSTKEYRLSESTLREPPITNETAAANPDTATDAATDKNYQQLKTVAETAQEQGVDQTNNGDNWVYGG